MADFTVIGEIVVDDSGTASIRSINSELDQIESNSENAGGAFAKLGDLADFVFGEVIVKAVTSAASALIGFVSDSIGLAETHQTIWAQFQNTLSNYVAATGDNADVIRQNMQLIGEQMDGTTRFSKDAVTAAETVLLQYGKLSQAVFPDAVKAASDLAIATGTDLPTAAEALGKALGDPVMGIGRLNQQFKLFEPAQLKAIEHMAKLGNTTQAQFAILDALHAKIGGAAQADADTTAGKWAILGNAFDEVRIAIGSALLPALSQLADTLTPYINKILPQLTDFMTNKVGPALHDVVTGVGDFVNSLITGQKPTTDIGQKIAKVADDVGTFIGNVITFAQKVGTVIGDTITIAGEISTALQPVFDIGKKILDFAGTLVSIGATIVSNLVDGASQEVSQLWKAGSDWINGLVAVITAGGPQIGTALINGANNAIADLKKTVSGWVDAGKSMIDGVIAGVQAEAGNLALQAEIAGANALISLKNSLGIHSPSKAFMEVGVSMMQGVETGILQSMHLPALALQTFASSAVNTTYSTTYANRTTINNYGSSRYTTQGDNTNSLLQAMRTK